MKIAVYCSAKDSIPEEYLRLGDELGAWLAQNGHVLVYGGATGGLMSRVSEAAKACDGYVIGVIPPRIISAGRMARHCDELYRVRSMSERKQAIRDMSDVIVCMPGGYGTLDELFDAAASGTVGEHHKPLFVLNHKGCYGPLKEQIDLMRSLNFIPAQEAYKPVFVDSLDELKDAIANVQIKTKIVNE